MVNESNSQEGSPIEAVKKGIQNAKSGDLKTGLSVGVMKALAQLKSNPETIGQYFALLEELVDSNTFIRRTDVEKSIRSLLPDDEKDASKVSAADEIVLMVTENSKLFTDQEDQAYVFFEQDGHREVWPVNSSTFKDWVSMQQYSRTGRTPRAAALTDAFSTLNGIARHDGETHHVYLRVACDDSNGYYLDMGDDKWRVIHITPESWQVLDQSPVMFRRTKATKALPMPGQDGKLSDLKTLVNIDEKDDVLLITILVDSIRPDTAYPVTEWVGDQGSGKSTNAEHKRRLIDPNAVNLRSQPKTVEDYFVSAKNNHQICLNNLSRLSADEQDAICNLSTGGGYASRKLYTNDDESIFEAKRPVDLNGIVPTVTRPDLISRVVRLTCPTLDGSKKRLDDKELEKLFQKHSPLALGFLLDTMVSALSTLPSIVIKDKPRLMDFTKLGAAIGRAIDPENGETMFLKRYRESREAASIQALESMPVIVSLIDYLELHAPFAGNYSELLKDIESKIGKTVDAAWPKSARGLSDAVGRAKPTLNLLGWTVSVGARTNKGASVTIKKTDFQYINSADSSSTTDTNSTESVESDGRDGRDGENRTIINRESTVKMNSSEENSAMSQLDREVI